MKIRKKLTILVAGGDPMSTIFAKIIRREIPATVVYEDDLCMAFRDIQSVAPTHILIIPKKEIRSMAEVQPEDHKVLGHMMVKAAEIAEKEGLAAAGYRLVVNTNKDGGMAVPHLHIHILGGRKMAWPPG